MYRVKAEWINVGVRMLIMALLLLVLSPSGHGLAAEAVTDCDIHVHACQKAVGDRSVALDIQPKPVTAMKDLVFRVTVSGDPLAQAPFIDLGMPGMRMGPNQVKLAKTGPNTYEGKGVIVRCPSGKRIWRATVTLPDIGKVAFTFDVVY